MTEKTSILTVTAAIIERDGKYLISRRKAQDTMGGMWEFPGGGVDEGETPDQCVVREIWEELGVKAKALSLYDAAVGSEGHIIILFYRCSIEGEPQALDSDELQWVSPEQLAEYRMLPADADVVARLIKD